jgi:hypothetical protein
MNIGEWKKLIEGQPDDREVVFSNDNSDQTTDAKVVVCHWQYLDDGSYTASSPKIEEDGPNIKRKLDSPILRIDLEFEPEKTG